MTEDEKAQRRLERLKFRLAHTLELVRATTAFEHAGLRPPLILNGGALVVSLTLFGALQKQSGTINGRPFKFALILWIVGVLLAPAATAFGYYSQAAFRKFRDRELDETWAEDEGDTVKAGDMRSQANCEERRGWARRRVAELAVAFSMLFFLAGVCVAIIAIP